ncbi:MAG: hypothetical protein AB2598_17605 [Candidatus Thiodiazotropha sp.]
MLVNNRGWILFAALVMLSFLIVGFVLTLNVAFELQGEFRYLYDLDTSLTYYLLSTSTAIIYWLSVFLKISALIVWAYLCHLLSLFIFLVFDGAFAILDKKYKSGSRQYFKYERSIGRLTKNEWPIVYVAFGLIVSIALFIAFKKNQLDIANALDILIYVTLLVVFYVHAHMYISFYRIRSTRKNVLRFDEYLFSKHSMDNTFASVLTAMVFFAILGWFLMPIYGFICTEIDNMSYEILLTKYDYNTLWEKLSVYGIAPYQYKKNFFRSNSHHKTR